MPLDRKRAFEMLVHPREVRVCAVDAQHRLQAARHVARRAGPGFLRFREELEEELHELRLRIGAMVREIRRWLGQDTPRGVCGICRRIEPLSSKELEEDDAQRKEIRPPIQLLEAELLRGHVADLSLEQAGRRPV